MLATIIVLLVTLVFLGYRLHRTRYVLLCEQLACVRLQEQQNQLKGSRATWRRLAVSLLEAGNGDYWNDHDSVGLEESRQVVTESLERLSR